MYWGSEEEEEEELVDLLKCSECKELFETAAGVEPKECPLCGTKFDGEE